MQVDRKLWLPILLAGIVTAAITMAAVYYMDTVSSDANIMGWYANGIIPIGAVLVGIAAGSGYGIASWLTGFKIKKDLLIVILCTQVVAYFGVEYFGYTVLVKAIHSIQGAENAHISFFEYLDTMTKSMVWKGTHGGSDTPLGAWGYAFRLLEVTGFCLGGLIVPMAISGITYCEQCQRYWQSKKLTLISGSAPKPFIGKPDPEVQQAAATEALQTVEKLRELARNGDTYGFREVLNGLQPNKGKAKKADVRYSVAISHCPNCNDARLIVTRMEGHGRQVQSTVLEKVTPPTHFAKSIFEK